MNDQLLKAANEGDIKELFSLIQQGADLGAKDSMGNTVLHIAIQKGNFELIKRLLQHGANVALCNGNGESPMGLIHRMKNTYLILLCYIVWIDQFISNYNQNTMLEKRWNKECFHSPLFNEVLNTIHKILKSGYRETIDFKENKENKEIKETLEFLAKEEKKEIVDKLSIIIFNNHFHKVIPHLVYNLLKLMFRDESPLFFVLRLRRTDMLACFLENRLGDINERGKCGNTALHLAARNGNFEIVDLLLSHGANVNERNHESSFPIHEAVKSGKENVIERLLKQGAFIDPINIDGKTPFKLAQENNNNVTLHILTAATKLLLFAKNGPDQNRELYDSCRHMLKDFGDALNFREIQMGDTLLHAAIRSGNMPLAELLLKQKEGRALISTRNEGEKTPFHLAVKANNRTMVEKLLELGADINAMDDFGPPLRTAAIFYHLGMVKCLLKHGAKLNQVRSNGETILQEIRRNHVQDALPLLEAATSLLKLAEENQFDVNVLEEICDTLRDGLNAVNQQGNSALHFAFFNKNREFYRFLLKRGASNHIKNDKNEMPVNEEFQTERGLNLFYSLIGKITQCIFDQDRDRTNSKKYIAEIENTFRTILKHLPRTYENKDAKEVKESKEVKTQVEYFSETNLVEIQNELKRIITKYELWTDIPDMVYKILVELSREGSPPLLIAARWGKLGLFKHLLDNKLSHIGEVDHFGNNSLHITAMFNSFEIAQYILKNNLVALDDPNKEGNRALNLAEKYDHVDLVRYLLKCGAEIKWFEDIFLKMHSQSSKKSLDLLIAASKLIVCVILDSKQSSESLFKILGNGLNGRSGGNTALHIASKDGNLEWVQELIKNGADATLVNHNHCTPLHLAACFGHTNIVKVLLPFSDLRLKTKQGDTALSLAIFGEHVEIVRFLFSVGDSIYSLGAKHGKILLQAMQDQNISNATFPLLKAAANLLKLEKNTSIEDKNLNEILNVLGDGLNARGDDGGNTILHLAVVCRNLRLIKTLVEKGARNLKNYQNRTALHLAAWNGYPEIIDYLLDRGFSSTAERDDVGMTALHQVCYTQHANVIRCLLRRGIKIDSETPSGKIAAQILNVKNSLDEDNFYVCKKLLEDASTLLDLSENSGHDLKNILDRLGDALNAQRDKDGNTALHIAFKRGNILLVKELLKRGASIHIKNDQNQSPIHHFQDPQLNAVIISWICIGKLNNIIAEIKKGINSESEQQISLLNEILEKFLKIFEVEFKGQVDVEEAKEAKELKESKDIKENEESKLFKEAIVKFKLVQEISDEIRNIIFEQKIHRWFPHMVYRLIGSITTELYPPFIIAASYGQEELMECFLDKGLSKITENVNGDTALHVAAYYGRKNIIQYFVRKNPSMLTKRNNHGCSLLLKAAMGGNCSMINFLLENKYSGVSEVDNYGHNALHLAAMYGKVSAVRELLLKKQFKITDKDANGRTALHLAAQFGENKVITELWIESIAISEDVDNCGLTPLHLAVKYEKEETVKLLMSHGVALDSKVQAPENNSKIAQILNAARILFKCEEYGSLEIKQAITILGKAINARSRPSGNTPLHFAIKSKNRETLKLLLSQGANSYLRNYEAFTPLLMAAIMGDLDTIKYLIEHDSRNAVFSHRDTFGNSALHFAAKHGHVEIIKYLLKEKLIAVNDTNGQGLLTALDMAVSKNQIQALEVLLSHGAKLRLEDYAGKRTAVDVAIEEGHHEALQCLLKYGGFFDLEKYEKYITTQMQKSIVFHNTKALVLLEASIKLMEFAERNTDVKNSMENILMKKFGDCLNARQHKDGNTALHWAIKHNNLQRVKLLLDHGANIMLANANGDTPLHFAVSLGRMEIVQELLKRGANSKVLNKQACSVVMLASVVDRLDILKLLLKKGAYIDLSCISKIIHDHPNKTTTPLLKALSEFLKFTNSLQGQRDINVSKINAFPYKVLKYALNARGIEDGNTALHKLLYQVKVSGRRRYVIKRLLNLGASISIKNDKDETPMDLALQTKNTYLIALFYIAAIKKYGLEQKKNLSVTTDLSFGQNIFEKLCDMIHEMPHRKIGTKDGKRPKERKEIKETLDPLSPKEKREICFKLGRTSHTYKINLCQPHVIYELLSEIDPNSHLYPKANELMYEMLVGRQVVVEQENIGESGSSLTKNSASEMLVSRDLCFRTAILHLLESNSPQQGVLGKLAADYVNYSDSIRGINGVTGKSETSFVAMLDFLKITIQKFKESKTEHEVVTVTLQKTKDRFETAFKQQQEKLKETIQGQIKIGETSRAKQQQLKDEIERLKAKIRIKSSK